MISAVDRAPRAVPCHAGSELGGTTGAAPRKTAARRVFEAARVPVGPTLKLRQEMAYLPYCPVRLSLRREESR